MNFLFIFIFSVLSTIIINRLLLAFSKNLGTRGAESIQVRWASTTKPSLGGFAFYLVFLGIVGITGLLDLQSTLFTKSQLIGVFIAISAGFAIGFADDTYNTNPRLKALGQLFCASVLFFGDIQIQIFESNIFNFLFTTFWVVGLMNSINMLDNMDGVTTSASLFIIFIFLYIIYTNNEIDISVSYILIALFGSLFGFLYHNWYPSKMYMGDAGSQFLGIFLAIFSIPLIWNNPSLQVENSVISNIVFPVLVFCVPLFDTITVIYYRLKRKVSPFTGGSDHTTHHLVYSGFTERQVVLFFLLINIIGFSFIYLVLSLNQPLKLIELIILIYIIMVFITLQFLYIKGLNLKAKGNRKKMAKSPRMSLYEKIIS